MKRILLSLLLCAVLLLSACAPSAPPEEPGLNVAAATYPVYLFARQVAAGAEGITLTNIVQQPTSCLHDYTLTVSDMKALERADLVLLSGAGLEEFMEEALESAGTPHADCSVGVELLPAEEHDHDHEEHEEHDNHDEHEHEHEHDHGEFDAHIWMDPGRAAVMVGNIADALAALDPTNAELYRTNAAAYQIRLTDARERMREALAGLSCRELITFHEGFGYYADAMGLTVLRAIEEEAGSEASAREIVEVSDLVLEHGIPAIFTEYNGSDATAGAISRETGAAVYPLSMIMSADAAPQADDPYLAALERNTATILEALG